MAYKIEKGIPIAKAIKSKHHSFPFDEMAVGDSFEVGPEDMTPARNKSQDHSRRHKTLYTTRMTERGIRIWRIV